MYKTYLLVGFLFFTCLATTAYAQGADVDILDRGRASFAVSAYSAVGGSAEDAGQLAMQTACEETLGRGFTHISVSIYETSTRSNTVQTRDESTSPVYDGRNGIVVGQRRQAAEQQTIVRGSALLSVSVMDEETAIGPDGTIVVDWFQLVDARTCQVIHTP